MPVVNNDRCEAPNDERLTCQQAWSRRGEQWKGLALALFMDLLREIVLVPDFFDGMELGFNPVNMLLFLDQNML